MDDLRHDFEHIPDRAAVMLFPADANPLHRRPVRAIYAGGYFHCDGSDPSEGPDYYLGDVAAFCRGFRLEDTP